MRSFLASRLKEILAEAIRDKVTLVDDRVNPMLGWNAEMSAFLAFCVGRGHITADEVNAEVRKRINKLGREEYKTHLRTREYPDHLTSPEALAFAMRSGELKPEEIKNIEFDDGDTPETFYQMINESFVQKIASQLLGESEFS